ncbi:MAG: PQQ-binding-like beta-propeller repeat protein [Verrucomicrobiota bacterium]
MKTFSIAIAGFLTLLSHAPGDWLQFRGPDGLGLSKLTDLPVHLDEQSIGWKKKIPGRGLSSPIVVGDQVIITASGGPLQDRLYVISYDAASGEPNWTRQFWATGRTVCHEKTSVAAPTPVSDGEKIFALYSSNDVVCLDTDGNLLWLRGLTRDYPNASNSLGMASSPVFADGTLIVQVENDSESFTAGLDPVTGKNRWKKDRPKSANWTSPTLVQDAGSDRKLVALQSSKGVSAVVPSTGEEVWNFPGGASTIPSSAAHGTRFFVPSNGLTAIDLSEDSRNPRQLWQAEKIKPGTASLVVTDRYVYSISRASILECADINTGDRLWRTRLKGPVGGSPIIAGNYLYAVSERGMTQIVDISGDEGKVVSELDLGQPILCTPAVSEGALYVRSNEYLWKLKKS